MKGTKKIIALLLLVAMVLGLAACSSTPASIVGVWEMEMEDYYKLIGDMVGLIGGDDYGFGGLMDFAFSQSEATMEFTPDGQVIMRMYFMGSLESQDYMTYTIEGNKLIIDGSPMDFTLRRDKLILRENGMKLELTRR